MKRRVLAYSPATGLVFDAQAWRPEYVDVPGDMHVVPDQRRHVGSVDCACFPRLDSNFAHLMMTRGVHAPRLFIHPKAN